MKPFASTGLKVDAQGLHILDQTQLPHKEVWLNSRSAAEMIAIIKALKVRGAPLIGVAAAMQLAWNAENGATTDELLKDLEALREARPTAVNLMNALDRMRGAVSDQCTVEVAEAICEEDVKFAQGLGEHTAAQIKDGDNIITHCNTGGLATVGLGTALGGIICAHQQGKKIHVFVDETRPLLQGARLTTWELARHKIPHTLICDNMAGALMAQGKVDRAFVGADRIARNGDFANKVGTYGLAVLCRFHSVPFYVVAPRTTLDLACPDGSRIPIEERTPDEVRAGFAPKEVAVWNPAFDVTPEALVSGWIMDDQMYTREEVRAGRLCGQ